MSESEQKDPGATTPYYCDPPTGRSPDDWRSFVTHPVVFTVMMVVVTGILLPVISTYPGGRLLTSVLVGCLSLWSFLDLNFNRANPRFHQMSRPKRIAWSIFLALSFSLYLLIQFRW